MLQHKPQILGIELTADDKKTISKIKKLLTTEILEQIGFRCRVVKATTKNRGL